MAATGHTNPQTTLVQAQSPIIIEPEEHPITVDQIDRDALFVLKKLNNAGFSAYLVGGGVRDLYIGKPPKDYDISTDARPGQIRKLFPNSNTIGKRFRLVQVFFPKGKIIEVSTLRSLSEHDLDGPEAILAPNNTFGTLDEDAQRRDLTINSLFFEIEGCTIIDYVDGVKDLDHSIIRMVGDPEKRIHRDPVRMMRAIRHSARHNFTIEEATWKAICENVDKLSLCPASRLRDELFKDLFSGAAASWLEPALDSGIFFRLLPVYHNTFFTSHTKGPLLRERIARILSVIDRLNLLQAKNDKPKPSQSFLLALLLIPWADQNYNLSNQYLKGPAVYHFSKRLRNDLDKTLGLQLNLRRSIRQEIAMLLTNLPIFMQQRRNGSWPKWLQKKSYFKESALFYHFYREAFSDQPIPEHSIELIEVPSNYENSGQFAKKKSHRKIKPAFSSRRRGGVFGFKK